LRTNGAFENLYRHLTEVAQAKVEAAAQAQRAGLPVRLRIKYDDISK
jgi:hypothetical protein